MRPRNLIALLLSCLCGISQAQTTLYVHGNIYTSDPARPRAEAIAVAGDRIVQVGSDAECRAAAGDGASIVDLKGRTVLPGLIDAHGHVASLGTFGMGRLEFAAAKSFDDVVAKVAKEAKKTERGKWILGGRWDHESWTDRTLPSHGPLSAMSPDNPAWLTRVDGHAALANAKAMELAGVTKDTPNPPGGEIIRDKDGSPTGIFVDAAKSLVEHVIPPEAREADPEQLLLKAQEMCVSAGLTGVHDMGIAPGDIDTYRRLADSGKLKLRVYALISGPYAAKYMSEHGPYISPHFSLRSVKLYMDGAMGSRGAWLLEPYADRPKGADGQPYAGLAVSKPKDIESMTKLALEKGFQVCTHAIGDRGNREALDAYERALKAAGSPKDHRLRIEHAQLLSPADIPRFARLGVIPSMQPTHCTSDMRWVDARVGPDRARGAYAWGSLLRSGARIAAGSDFPVEEHNPFLGFYAAVSRQNDKGEPAGGWHQGERMTREEILRAMTIDAAYAAFEENDKGSLTAGKLADFIVIDRDVMTCPPHDLLETKVLKAVIGGQTVYAGDTIH